METCRECVNVCDSSGGTFSRFNMPKGFVNTQIIFFIETIDVESSGVWHDCHFKLT